MWLRLTLNTDKENGLAVAKGQEKLRLNSDRVIGFHPLEYEGTAFPQAIVRYASDGQEYGEEGYYCVMENCETIEKLIISGVDFATRRNYECPIRDQNFLLKDSDFCV